uniref:Putative hydrogenase expression/formation protein HupJ n=1 Tax=Rhodopseudomonas palustris (strain BisA53) TaxID=316055 RepID=Q07S93_RHOP5
MSADAAVDRDADARAAGEALAAFYRGAERSMRELPIYNPALRVAAIGFRAIDDHAFGVVVTPWFMNLVRVPLQRDHAALPQGAAVALALPAGTLEFTAGQLDGFGAIESCSLFSPMFGFADQAAAESAAAAALAAVLDPQFDAAAATAEPVAPDSPASPPAPLDRRRFLRGELTERRP